MSLLESLIAMVVTALGVFGVMSLQIRTLVDTQTSVRRAQAIRLIEDLSERIRTNPNGLMASSNYVIDWNSEIPTNTEDCKTNSCDYMQLAKYDISKWLKLVRNTLPLGDAKIFIPDRSTSGGNNNRQIAVVIGWRENESSLENSYKDALGTAQVFGHQENDICTENKICHVQYLATSIRCMASSAPNNNNPQLFCPGD